MPLVQVKEWDQRRAGMDIGVRHLLQRHLPEWVRPTQNGAAAAAAAAAAAEAPAAPAEAQEPAAAPVVTGEPAAKQPLIGVKRPSTDGSDGVEQAAAKRQQTAAGPAAAAEAGTEAEAAVGQGSGGPPSRATSDLQVQDLQRPANGQQEVVEGAAGRCGALAGWWSLLFITSPWTALKRAHTCCGWCRCPNAQHLPQPAPPRGPPAFLPLQAPVTAAGAAETAAERQAASQEAQLAAVGEVGEWTVMQPDELAADGPADGPLPAAVAQPAKKAIAVK